MKPLCARCNKPFDPKKTLVRNKKMKSRCCEKCQARNLLDGLDLPTPPDLLDRYTKHPTLSKREFKEAMQ